MSKASRQEPEDDLRPEYDFSSMSGAVRGKYYKRYRAGVNLVLLEPEIARAFPTSTAVNEALRKVLRAATASKRRPGLRNKRTQQASSAKTRRGKQVR